MLNISNHYVDEAEKSLKDCQYRLELAREGVDRADRQLSSALQCLRKAKGCYELKRVSKQFKAMVVFPTSTGIYVQLGNVLLENAEKIKQYLEVEMEFKPEVMRGGSVIYYSPVGHQYFVRYV